LVEAGVGEPRLDARLLIAHVTDSDTASVFGFPERGLDDRQVLRLGQLVKRRVGREPMAHILGTREFWSLPFIVTRDTLVPRPDSETLIEAVLEQIPDTTKALSILDLGTGSGCLLLALLSEFPNAKGVGVDLSDGALHIAGQNAEALGLDQRATFVKGDWTSDLKDRYDVVITNPPYIPSDEIQHLAADVASHEPVSALDGGVDGLDSYRMIIAHLPGVLAEGASVFLETGVGQAPSVAAMIQESRLQVVDIKKDLSGTERCVVGAEKIPDDV
ncbi:MAG: peptide chain release factor N(5)-glutamine methyltransferase, partial [Rhodospirillaceae bacterium]|nr:peptide chain release factor N(5)-glutamine methyltransferase [Rhodospirillaceae bacterium]